MPTTCLGRRTMSKGIVVIGGGAAGMMAAVSAAEQGGAVTLLEPNERGVLRMTMQDDNEARFIPAPQPAGAAGSSS